MTEPGGGTRVRFRRGGSIVAETVVPGRLLEIDLPRSVTFTRRDNRTVDLVETDDPRLECCGQLLLPSVGPDGPRTTVLDVPVPWPFSAEDLRQMWLARNRIENRRRPATSGQADWSSLLRITSDRLDWATLEEAVQKAVELLGTWPTTPVRDVRWLAPDRVGGVLLVGATERSRRNHVFSPGTQRMPAVTARRIARPEERRLHALTAVAGMLAGKLQSLPELGEDPALQNALAGLFRRVAARSHPGRSVADPPPSVWPAPMVSLYSACLRALSTVRDVGPGEGPAPLAEIWELYQAWVADQVVAGLRAQLGEPRGGGTRRNVLGHWTDGDGELELRYQASVPRGDSRATLDILGEQYIAVVGPLQPDLLVVRRVADTARAVVVDAKKRSATMTLDDLTDAVSKYQWGVRRQSDRSTVPVLESTVLVSPLDGPSALPEGRGQVVTTSPSRPSLALVVDLLALLR